MSRDYLIKREITVIHILESAIKQLWTEDSNKFKTRDYSNNSLELRIVKNLKQEITAINSQELRIVTNLKHEITAIKIHE